jgi:hypothetical protein
VYDTCPAHIIHLDLNTIKYLVKVWARIAQRYIAGLRAVWSGVRVPAEVVNFSLQIRGAHPATYPMVSVVFLRK